MALHLSEGLDPGLVIGRKPPTPKETNVKPSNWVWFELAWMLPPEPSLDCDRAALR